MLKYSFKAQFKDGTSLDQNDEDKSTIEEGRSAFYDVLQREADLLFFTLIGDGHIYRVNLTNGLFTMDNVKVRLHDEPIKDFRLIFFRQHTHDFNGAYTEIGHNIVYKLGWQGINDNGKNVQRIIYID